MKVSYCDLFSYTSSVSDAQEPAQTVRKPHGKIKVHGPQAKYFISDEAVTVHPKLIEFAIVIRNYRRSNNLSQKDLAEACSIIGKKAGVKMSSTDIHGYENYMHVPSAPKFQVLLNTMGLTESDL